MLGATLIFTPDHGYVDSSVLQTTCKVQGSSCEVKLGKVKGFEAFPLLV